MIAWRLTKRKWADQALSGEGARLAGGRWNNAGWPVVYLSENLSLCVLEILAHTQDEDFGDRFVAIPMDIPDALIREIRLADLPRDWTRRKDDFRATRRIGDEWILGRKSAALRVPSILVPRESNLILNTLHPDFHRVKAGPAEPFWMDPRFRNKLSTTGR